MGLGVADEDATEINSECVSLNKYLESAGQNTFGAKGCGLWQADSIPTSVRPESTLDGCKRVGGRKVSRQRVFG